MVLQSRRFGEALFASYHDLWLSHWYIYNHVPERIFRLGSFTFVPLSYRFSSTINIYLSKTATLIFIHVIRAVFYLTSDLDIIHKPPKIINAGADHSPRIPCSCYSIHPGLFSMHLVQGLARPGFYVVSIPSCRVNRDTSTTKEFIIMLSSHSCQKAERESAQQ